MKIGMILILSGLVLLIVGAAVKAYSFRRWIKSGGATSYETFTKYVLPRLSKRLALSPEQQEKLKLLAKPKLERLQSLRADLVRRRALLAALVGSKTPNDAAISTEVNGIRATLAEIAKLVDTTFAELQTILTPLQQGKLALLRGRKGHRRHCYARHHVPQPAQP